MEFADLQLDQTVEGHQRGWIRRVLKAANLEYDPFHCLCVGWGSVCDVSRFVRAAAGPHGHAQPQSDASAMRSLIETVKNEEVQPLQELRFVYAV